MNFSDFLKIAFQEKRHKGENRDKVFWAMFGRFLMKECKLEYFPPETISRLYNRHIELPYDIRQAFLVMEKEYTYGEDIVREIKNSSSKEHVYEMASRCVEFVDNDTHVSPEKKEELHKYLSKKEYGKLYWTVVVLSCIGKNIDENRVPKKRIRKKEINFATLNTFEKKKFIENTKTILRKFNHRTTMGDIDSLLSVLMYKNTVFDNKEIETICNNMAKQFKLRDGSKEDPANYVLDKFMMLEDAGVKKEVCKTWINCFVKNVITVRFERAIELYDRGTVQWQYKANNLMYNICDSLGNFLDHDETRKFLIEKKFYLDRINKAKSISRHQLNFFETIAEIVRKSKLGEKYIKAVENKFNKENEDKMYIKRTLIAIAKGIN